ncbi:MAG: hypothetical protein C0522_08380 [Rhodocyclaceae bacterium]|jgi:predicted Zn finger-like uncharacterized protein|nr:hypothetical protein [Rhodocyclaceae bacterium]
MMFTRCPSCGTAFRVTPEQLKARAGKVRCGHCNAVFNALDTLEDAQPAAPTAAESIAATAGQPPRAVAENTPAEPVEEPAPPAVTGPEAESGEISGGTDAAPQARPSRRRAFAWSLATLAMLALLGAQAAYVFRAELVLLEPDLRPALEEMCAALDCDIPLPHKAELVSIETSDLHPDPKQKNLLVLAATLKNRAPFAQAYPHLELTLTDTRDQPLARRVFAPADYLAQEAGIKAGFAANGDLAVNLWLDAASVAATGYRLYLFYP